MDKLIVTIMGLLGIGGIYWFFFGKNSTDRPTSTSWSIRVNGGYTPGTITIPKGKRSTLIFTRTDSNSCLEEVMLPDFKIKTFLPVNVPVTITLSPAKPGTHDLHCGMNMFHGKVVVV